MNKTHQLVVLCLWTFSSLSIAKTTLPSFFTDHMVMQQNNQVAFWGFDNKKQTVNIETSWGEKLTTTTNTDGRWQVELSTPKADFKSHTITVQGSDTKKLKDVLLGEVWFASGQSNMSMRVKGALNQPIFGSNDAILMSENNQIRMFYAKLTSTSTPQSNIAGEWLAASLWQKCALGVCNISKNERSNKVEYYWHS